MKFLKNLGVVFVGAIPFAVIIGVIVLWSNWNDGVYVGTYWEELIPAILLGLGVGFAIWLMLGSSKTFSVGSSSIFAVVAILLTVTYKLLDLNETVGIVLLSIVFGGLIVKSWFIK